MVTSGPIRNDIGFAYDARSCHAEWLEHTCLKEVAIKLSGDFVDQDAECDVTEVAILPLFSRLERGSNCLCTLEHFIFGVVAAKIEIGRVVSETRCVC